MEEEKRRMGCELMTIIFIVATMKKWRNEEIVRRRRRARNWWVNKRIELLFKALLRWVMLFNIKRSLFNLLFFLALKLFFKLKALFSPKRFLIFTSDFLFFLLAVRIPIITPLFSPLFRHCLWVYRFDWKPRRIFSDNIYRQDWCRFSRNYST